MQLELSIKKLSFVVFLDKFLFTQQISQIKINN